MTATFLERNKKKSVLAALLLFLRQRKVLVLLLLLVMIASTVFVSPSSWITGLPGGERFAAGVAWIAGKMGVDVSRWGLGTSGKHSYGDLLAAFREARMSGNGAGGVGWGAFFGRGGGAAGGGAGSGEGSLGFVKGSKSDLEHGVGAGAGGAGGPQSVAGIADPADAKTRGGDAVTLSEADLGGERAGYVDGANAHGFTGNGSGASGEGGAGGDGAGGAYASKGFFSGTGGAAGTPGGLAKAGLGSLPAVATPGSAKGGAAQGALSAMASRAVETRATKGVMSAGSLSDNHAFAQAAEGKARADIGDACKPPNCPAEYASTNAGAMYDGNTITSGFLTSSDPGGNAAGLINSTVDVPPQADDNSAMANATEMAACTQDSMACANQQQQMAAGFVPLQNQINQLAPQLPHSCVRQCDCGGCNSLNNSLQTQCNGVTNLSNQISGMSCSMPADCSSLGVNAPPNMQSVGMNCPTMACDRCPHILGICICWL